MYYLIGGSGAPNYGDELILLQWLRFLHEEVLPHHGTVPVVVDNNSVTGSTALFGARYPGVQFVSCLKRLHHDRSKGSFLKNLVYGLGFFSEGHWRQHPELSEAVAQVREARLIHLYGGGYINTWQAASSAFLIGLLADAARSFEMPVVATGIGITPLQFEEGENTAPLRQALKAFSQFELRDFFGHGRLRQLAGEAAPLLCGQDDAFLYPVQAQPHSGGVRRLHLSAYRAGNIFAQPGVQDWLRQHAPSFGETVYWECAPHLEQDIVEGLRACLPELRVASVDELLFQGPPAHPGDHMISMRYHPHLVGARLGVSGQYLAQSTYYEHKHGAVLQAGSRFRRIKDECGPPTAVDQPLAWRDAGWVALKQALARRLYGLA